MEIQMEFNEQDSELDFSNEDGFGGGTNNYTSLYNKPSINGVVLTGNKTTSDLHIAVTGGLSEHIENEMLIFSMT